MTSILCIRYVAMEAWELAGSEEVTLQIKVSPRVKREILVRAAQRGETIRTYILKAISDSGVPIPEADLVDRRQKSRPNQTKRP